MEPSLASAEVHAVERVVRMTTDNVDRLAIDVDELDASWFEHDAPLDVVIDGDELAELEWPASGEPLVFTKGETWASSSEVDPRRKGPHRSGPFKDAWRNRAVLVVGTAGDAAANEWALAKARYDAETFGYRGNGDFEIVTDVSWIARGDSSADRDRNVILYGNADTNAAWEQTLGGCTIEIREGTVRVGSQEFTGEDLGCVFVFPRTGSSSASVGVVAGSGPSGRRATTNLPWFVSGAGFPDWTLVDASIAGSGAMGIVGAGFFDSDWTLGSDAAWR